MRLIRGTLPVAVVLGLLYALSRKPRANPLEPIVVEILCAIALWLGWRWMRGTFEANDVTMMRPFACAKMLANASPTVRSESV